MKEETKLTNQPEICFKSHSLPVSYLSYRTFKSPAFLITRVALNNIKTHQITVICIYGKFWT